MEMKVLIRHVKGQLSAPLHADSEVCLWFACEDPMQTHLECVANAQSFLSLPCDDTSAVLRKPGEFQEAKI